MMMVVRHQGGLVFLSYECMTLGESHACVLTTQLAVGHLPEECQDSDTLVGT